MSKISIFKICVLTMVFIGLRLFSVIREIDLIDLFYILGYLGMLYSTYLIIFKKNSFGVCIWLGSFIMIRIIDSVYMWRFTEIVQYFDFIRLLIVSFFSMVITLIVCRLFLQWTSNLWKKRFSFSETFWKWYIGVESFSIILFSGMVMGLLDLEGGSKTLLLLGGMYASQYYNKIIKQRYMPLLTGLKNTNKEESV